MELLKNNSGTFYGLLGLNEDNGRTDLVFLHCALINM